MGAAGRLVSGAAAAWQMLQLSDVAKGLAGVIQVIAEPVCKSSYSIDVKAVNTDALAYIDFIMVVESCMSERPCSRPCTSRSFRNHAGSGTIAAAQLDSLKLAEPFVSFSSKLLPSGSSPWRSSQAWF